ncbi:MAG: biotin carboxylase N-terminal domain-containing protein, partial [Lachnospiraceae bacterium]
MFNKILVANRGEIAVRIIRACRELGIKTVAVYSEADAGSLHTRLADESICIGTAAGKDSYLNMKRILAAALATKAQAIHPGFGFLSENSDFAEICDDFNLKFIGPSARTINMMGNKAQARNTMIKAGIPVVFGDNKPLKDVKTAKKAADNIGYPVMIKAALGGGGKGMRVVRCPEEFEELFNLAQAESSNAFGDNNMYLEKYIEKPRHVEVQILADKFGNVIHVGERDCSIQKNHQKVIEETPCLKITKNLRNEIGSVAVNAARAVGYEG